MCIYNIRGQCEVHLIHEKIFIEMNSAVENNYVKFWIEDEMVHGFYKKGCILSLKAAKEIVEARLKLQKGKTYKGLIYVTHIKVMGDDAKKFLAKEGCEGIEKAALVSSSAFMAMLGNVFISFNKPIIPTKLFFNKEDEMKWLKFEELVAQQ
jgi:hypothetical protein